MYRNLSGLLASLTILALPGLSACGDSAPSASCTNGVQDPGETGVDCGGSCAACEVAQHPCDNGVQDAGETGVDCGGSCIPCGQAPTCVDGFQNQGEAGVDCGGPCPACAAGPVCDNGVQDGNETGVDCGGSCPACGTAPTCTDGVRNQGETDVDCAGPCDPCATGKACQVADDCATDICTSNVCVAPSRTCGDGVRSGDETDVDCGGSCPGCAYDKGCGVGGDCQSGVCNGGRCADPTCTDGVRNGFESDVDCGPGCEARGPGKRCEFGPDCASGACGGGVCVNCSDGIKNAKETDIDCGGDICAPCDGGEGCAVDADCAGELCENNICVSCDNGRRDGDESDVDCGGSCDLCAAGAACNSADDCLDVYCNDGRCVAASCHDGIWNGDEADVDCGGDCVACEAGDRCSTDDECELRLYCGDNGRCQTTSLEVEAGDDFTCTLNEARGTVYCWGANDMGQLGQGNTTALNQPTLVRGLPEVAQLSVGAKHVCVATHDHRIYCWGDDRTGQSGDGTAGGMNTTPVPVPDFVTQNSFSTRVIAAGRSHTCALNDASLVHCWGANNRGQLGNGTTTQSLVPVAPVTIGALRMRDLGVGANHSCVTTASGQGGWSNQSYCWGDNTYAQAVGSHITAGIGGGLVRTYTDEPERVSATSAGAIAAGTRMSCMFAAGSVTCFGYLTYPSARSFSPVTGASDVACDTSGELCCASLNQQGGRCWTGDGGQSMPIAGLGYVWNAAVGSGHTCFVSASSQSGTPSVLCSGDNTDGQLGRGFLGGDGAALSGVVGFSDRGCANGRRDFDEGGVDCGGPCAPCAGGATCNDGQQNQGETGVDCGGPYAACAPTPTCNDGQQNQGETGVDCGGPCAPCSASGTCSDQAQNQGETGVDCGGPCVACSGTGNCSDQAQNQGETGVDCGGPCAACPTLTAISAMQQSSGSVNCALANDQTIAGGERTIEGIITVDSFTLNATLNATFISEGTQNAWSGMMVRFPQSEGWTFRVGQRVRLKGFHHEYFCNSQFRVTAYQPIGTGTPPAPAVIAKNLSLAEIERWEGVIVQMNNVTITGHTSFDDAETDAGGLIDKSIMKTSFQPPAVGTTLTRVIGALVYNFDEYRIAPRTAADM